MAQRKRKPTVADKRQTAVLEKSEEMTAIHTEAAQLKDELEQALTEVIDKFQERISELNQKAADASQFDLLSDVEETLSNMEEKFSGTERYQRLSEFKDAVEEAVQKLEGDEVGDMSDYDFASVIESLDNMASNAEDAASTLEGVDIP